MSVGLGLDGGGGGTRWVLADAAGAVVARGETVPLSGLVFSPGAEARAAEIVDGLAALILPHGTPHAVLAGVTGTTSGAPAAVVLAGLIARTFGLPAGRVEVTDDIAILHRACFPPGTGILLYSGTGSAGLHIGADGQTMRVGGLGHLIDDGGSGYAIARDALRTVLRLEEDGRGSGWSTMLGTKLAEAIGGREWDVVRAHVYGGDRGRMAALAVAVGQAAHAGDVRALKVLGQAGAELARLAQVLMRRVGRQAVALTGGTTRLHPRLHASLSETLGATVAMPMIDAAAACARLAALRPR